MTVKTASKPYNFSILAAHYSSLISQDSITNKQIYTHYTEESYLSQMKPHY